MSESRAPYRVTYDDPASRDLALQREADRLTTTDAERYVGPEPGLVRALMRRHDWSQVDVSEMVRVEVSTVRSWCADREQRQFSEIPFAPWWLLLAQAGVVPADGLSGSSVPGRVLSTEDTDELPVTRRTGGSA